MKREDRPRIVSNEKIEILLEEYKELLEIKGKYEDYKSRIEKAVDYIRQYDGSITGYYYSKEHKRFLAEDNVKDELLNILNGKE